VKLKEELVEKARCHPLGADAVLAVALGLVAFLVPHDSAEPTIGAGWVVVAIVTVMLVGIAFRRFYPYTVLGVVLVGTAVVLILEHGKSPILAMAFVAICTVAYRADRRASIAVWLTSGIVLAGAMAIGTGTVLRFENFSVFAWTGFAAAAASAVRSRKEWFAEVEQRAIDAEESREEEARRRVVAERLRIARELHDVVAHHIAVVHVQAGVADHLLDTKPAEAHEAIAHIRRASGSVLDELGGLLDVLRQPDEPIAPTAPAPGLGGLASLIDSFSASGLAIDVRAHGVPEPMPPAVELVAYRLVQESLTNAHKHGSGTATLDLTFEPGALGIDVANPCPEGTSPGGSGHGLEGMRERAKAVGGTVTTSIDDNDDAWHVAARLPFEPAV
jgi:signal transduction histidine kinase